jgi:recombination protein RecA
MAKEKNTKSNSKHVEVETNVERDDLALLLQRALNKSNKDGSKSSFFLDEDNPSEITEWVSTGSDLLDLAISNKSHGGLPVGRIAELSGLNGTGKSLICAHIIRETQKKGGLAVYFDSEFAVDREFWKSFGVDVRAANYNTFITLEELFTKIEICIGEFRKANRDKILTILVDSIAGASVEKEIQEEHGVQGYATSKALILGKAMRKITGLIAQQKILIVFTNQLRTVMNAGPFSEKFTTSGGMALAFHSSVRVRLAGMGKIKKGDEVIGMNARASVIKTRCGPNFRVADFEIHYDSGIQNLTSYLDFAKTRGIITGTAAKYTWKRENNDELQFNTARFVELMNSDEKLKEEFYQQICKMWIMEYRDSNSKIIENTVTVTEEENTAPLE